MEELLTGRKKILLGGHDRAVEIQAEIIRIFDRAVKIGLTGDRLPFALDPLNGMVTDETADKKWKIRFGDDRCFHPEPPSGFWTAPFPPGTLERSSGGHRVWVESPTTNSVKEQSLCQGFSAVVTLNALFKQEYPL
jgi:hypothetical protein